MILDIDLGQEVAKNRIGLISVTSVDHVSAVAPQNRKAQVLKHLLIMYCYDFLLKSMSLFYCGQLILVSGVGL